MTHEEVRALLPAYAAGALEESACEAVRMHLASGCGDCLEDVFARPVGLSRPGREPLVAEPPTPAAPPIPTAPRRPWLVTAVTVLALSLAAAVAWTVIALRARETLDRAKAGELSARLADAEAARARLEGRLAGVERQVAAAQDEAVRQADAARAAAEETARARDELDTTRELVARLTGELRRREMAIGRPRLRAGAPPAAQRLLASPGAELLHLRPAPPFRDVRGHVLYNPASDVLLVYAFGLPPLPSKGSYRVRVGLEDGREAVGRPLRADAHGAAAGVVGVDGTAARLSKIEIVIDPGGQRVLDWQRAD